MSALKAQELQARKNKLRRVLQSKCIDLKDCELDGVKIDPKNLKIDRVSLTEVLLKYRPYPPAPPTLDLIFQELDADGALQPVTKHPGSRRALSSAPPLRATAQERSVPPDPPPVSSSPAPEHAAPRRRLKRHFGKRGIWIPGIAIVILLLAIALIWLGPVTKRTAQSALQARSNARESAQLAQQASLAASQASRRLEEVNAEIVKLQNEKTLLEAQNKNLIAQALELKTQNAQLARAQTSSPAPAARKRSKNKEELSNRQTMVPARVLILESPGNLAPVRILSTKPGKTAATCPCP